MLQLCVMGGHTVLVAMMGLSAATTTADAQAEFGIRSMKHSQCFGILDVRLAEQALMGNRMSVHVFEVLVDVPMVQMMVVIVHVRCVLFAVRTKRIHTVRRTLVDSSNVFLFIVLKSFLSS